MRPIDADIIKFLKEQKVKETGAFSKGLNKGLNIAISAIKNPQICPTIYKSSKVLDPHWTIEGRTYPVSDYTHWMPLPQPPKGVE